VRARGGLDLRHQPRRVCEDRRLAVCEVRDDPDRAERAALKGD